MGPKSRVSAIVLSAATALTFGLLAGTPAAIAAPAAPTAHATQSGTTGSQLGPQSIPPEPPDCGPATDGEEWIDGDGNLWICAKKNGRWGWFLFLGCSAPAASATSQGYAREQVAVPAC